MSKILQGLAVVAEVTGTQLSKPALQVMERELSNFNEEQVLKALQRCMREVKNRFTLADVMDRLKSSDAIPGANEAWGIAIKAMDEAETVVWTNHMKQAFAVCRPVFEVGDEVGARMAFKDAYVRLSNSIPVEWEVSYGWDSAKRDIAIENARNSGLALPYFETPMIEHTKPSFIPPHVKAALDKIKFKRILDVQDTGHSPADKERARTDELKRISAEKVRQYMESK